MRAFLESLRHLMVNEPGEVVFPLVIFGVVFLTGWVVRYLILRAIKAWNARTASRSGGILLEALRGPLWSWSLMLAAHLAIQSSRIPAPYAATGASVLVALWILSLTVMSMRMAGDIVRVYGSQTPGAMPVTTLTETLVKITVLTLGALILLNHYRISITPILTALGVGGLAVALALQDTLSNLFGGFYVAIAGQVRLGDYVKLNSGEEGYVTDIGWRCTTFRAQSNNLIIVPNSKLSQAIVTNFYLPEKRMGASFQFTVSYEADLARVENAVEVVLADACGEVPGLCAEPAPKVTFDPGFTENGIALSANYHVQDFASLAPVRNQLRRRIYLKLKEIGVSMPYPSRTVYLQGGSSAAELQEPVAKAREQAF